MKNSFRSIILVATLCTVVWALAFSAGASAAEHAVQLLIEVAPQLFQVGRPLIAASTLLAPLWVVK